MDEDYIREFKLAAFTVYDNIIKIDDTLHEQWKTKMTQATLLQTHVFVNSRLLVDRIILEADIELTRDEVENYLTQLHREYEKYCDEAEILNCP